MPFQWESFERILRTFVQGGGNVFSTPPMILPTTMLGNSIIFGFPSTQRHLRNLAAEKSERERERKRLAASDHRCPPPQRPSPQHGAGPLRLGPGTAPRRSHHPPHSSSLPR